MAPSSNLGSADCSRMLSARLSIAVFVLSFESVMSQFQILGRRLFPFKATSICFDFVDGVIDEQVRLLELEINDHEAKSISRETSFLRHGRHRIRTCPELLDRKQIVIQRNNFSSQPVFRSWRFRNQRDDPLIAKAFEIKANSLSSSSDPPPNFRALLEITSYVSNAVAHAC